MQKNMQQKNLQHMQQLDGEKTSKSEFETAIVIRSALMFRSG